jgi:hypothetical protein
LERLVTDEGMPIVLINVPENAESGIWGRRERDSNATWRIAVSRGEATETRTRERGRILIGYWLEELERIESRGTSNNSPRL